MGSTKDKKKKRRRRVRAPPPLSVKATNIPKAIPTSILLEQQNFGRLIKNAKTAGLEINQPVYDKYQENIHVRSVLARHNRPDLGERLGYQARQMVRNLVLPRGHAPAREGSQRVDVPASPAPDPAPRTPASPATPSVIKEEKTVTLAERLAKGAETAIDLRSPMPPVEGREIEAMPLSKTITTPVIKKERSFLGDIQDIIDEIGQVTGSSTETAIPIDQTPQKQEFKLQPFDREAAKAKRLAREREQLDPESIMKTPPARPRVTRSAMQESSSEETKTPSVESFEELVRNLD